MCQENFNAVLLISSAVNQHWLMENFRATGCGKRLQSSSYHNSAFCQTIDPVCPYALNNAHHVPNKKGSHVAREFTAPESLSFYMQRHMDFDTGEDGKGPGSQSDTAVKILFVPLAACTIHKKSGLRVGKARPATATEHPTLLHPVLSFLKTLAVNDHNIERHINFYFEYFLRGDN